MSFVHQRIKKSKSEQDMGSKTDYASLPDIELIGRMRGGDPYAYTEIFNRYYSFLYSFANRRLDDKEASRDLIHDAFADIWRKRENVNIPGNLESFLVTIVKNRILNIYKHKKISQKYIDHFQAYLNRYEDNTDYLVRHNDLSKLIEKEIAALPEKMRVVFELSRKKSMTKQEIAAHLGLPENTVKTNLLRALKILKKKLPPGKFNSLFSFF